MTIQKEDAPLRILLVRHGESFNNQLLAVPGMTPERWQVEREVDPDLSDLGRMQATHLSRILSREIADPELIEALPIGMLAVSPQRRALQTIAQTAQRLGLRPQIWTDCFEVGGLYHSQGTTNGDHGITRSELQMRFPNFDIPDDVTEDGWYHLQRRESQVEVLARVQGTVARLRQLARQPDRP
eukprot:CAMPEP_0195076800 /NCGR_PEP_ID=MMETSP0448-20130528/19362_1 /TAXON_ID=66468 /ORGANISM="Heterocapsa triquestra, Strain CCMP 448" /LENGTH=183 /DNA_ID=CAMNT_0040109363 /DNA_START=52 /DNA_END=599 /DNA_ORIENTATION=-